MGAFFLTMEEQRELSVYEKNIKALELHYPMLLRDYRNALKNLDRRPDAGAEVEVVTGRRGHPTFKLKTKVERECAGGPMVFPRLDYVRAVIAICDELKRGQSSVVFSRATGNRFMPDFFTRVKEDKEVHGHSLFDPARDAVKRFGNSDDYKEDERIILLGFGFGYELREILRHMKHKVINIIEPYVKVFKAALETVDVSDIFEQHRCIVSFSVDPGDLQYAIMSHASPLSVPEYRLKMLTHAACYPKLYNMVARLKNEAATFIMFNLMTNIFAGPLFQRNLVMNFPVAMKNPGVCELEGKFSGRPVIIVAPGPSLDGNADQLRRVKGRALIIACDTATRILLRHGVEPDVIMSIDYQPANFYKLRDVDTSFAYLFPSIEVIPTVPMNHWGRMFNYYHSELTEKVYDPILGKRGRIYTGGSVLTDAFSMALLMGADPVIMVGVDLGFPGEKWYADGSFDNGKFTENLKDRKVDVIEIEDIHGGKMLTYSSFYEFLKWFRKRISLIDNRVIDATEGGAKIEGAEIMKLSDAIDEFVKDEGDPRAVLDEVYEAFEPPDIESVISKVEEFLEDYDMIYDEVEKGLKSSKRALDLIDRNTELHGNKELIRLLKKMNSAKEVFKRPELDTRLGLISPMIEKQMADIYYYEQDESIPKRDRYRKLVELDRNFYQNFLKACRNMKYFMNVIREDMLLEKDHEEFV